MDVDTAGGYGFDPEPLRELTTLDFLAPQSVETSSRLPFRFTLRGLRTP